MVYMFLGVFIVVDRFMFVIEVIIFKEKEVIVRKFDGIIIIVNIKIWNEIVFNLILMALGLLVFEILFSVIEICINNF